MKIKIGFSPCPNDTFIFDALVNGKIDTGEYDFEPYLEDVETLNQWALQGRLDITKISYGVWPRVMNNYALLDAGSALGMGVGPLLISNKKMNAGSVSNALILIPGENTTAHLLFSYAFPEAKNKEFIRYDEIEDRLLHAGDQPVAGVIIHENRFTYADKGLKLVADLGKYWEDNTGSPIPLGGIICRKSYDASTIHAINKLIVDSIAYSRRQYPSLSSYIVSHAQEMEESVMRKHIELYVNEFSLSLGEEGEKAVDIFKKVYHQMTNL